MLSLNEKKEKTFLFQIFIHFFDREIFSSIDIYKQQLYITESTNLKQRLI